MKNKKRNNHFKEVCKEIRKIDYDTMENYFKTLETAIQYHEQQRNNLYVIKENLDYIYFYALRNSPTV